MTSRYDVIVIGAGPAGSAAGYKLACEGIKTLIVDKSLFPRYKSCGGGIITRSDKFIPFDYSSVVERECKTALLADLTVQKEFYVTRNKPVVKMVMRDKFDQFILNKAIEAGCDFIPGKKVTHLEHSGKNTSVTIDGEKIFSRYIVGADGAFGMSAKVSGHAQHVTSIPAIEIELSVDDKTFAKYSDVVRFDFGLVENGYGWVFPKREHLSIGALSFTTGKYNLNDLLQSYLHSIGIKAEKYKSHGYKIPILPKTRNFGYSNLLLCGDAAGFADPITLEGIGTSFLSGTFAADAISTALNRGILASGLYNELIHKHILWELRYAKVLSRIIYNYPSVRKYLFTNLGAPLCEKMTDVITGDKSYSQYLSKSSNYFRLFSRLLK